MTSALIPFADIIESNNQSQVTYRYDDNLSTFVIEAQRDIKAKEIIRLSSE